MEFEPMFPTCQFNATKTQPVCFNKYCRKNKGSDKISQCPEILYTYIYECVVLCILYNFGTIYCGDDFVVVEMVSFKRERNVRMLYFKSIPCHWPCDEQFPLPQPSLSLLQREDNESDLLYKVL